VRPLVHGGTFRNRPGGGLRPRVQLDHVLAADHRAVEVELGWPP
jgi:hypothetical protein